MTQNGLIYLKAVDIKPRTQQIQANMCIIYMTFYTAFITKEHFQIFGEMVQKVLKMRKCNLFSCQICLHNIYDILYSFYNKRAFSNFWRNGPKSIENEEM